MSDAPSSPRTPDPRPAKVVMPTETIVFVWAVLSAWFLVASWIGWTAWTAVPISGGEVAVADSAAAVNASPAIDSVIPGYIVRRADTVGVTIHGSGFVPGTRVRINGTEVTPARISAEQLYVELDAAAQSQSPRIALTAQLPDPPADSLGQTPEGSISNAVTITSSNADRTRLLLTIGGRTHPIDQETRFLVLVLMIGSLGGVLGSFISLAGYRGERRLFESWTLHYLVSPFVAGGVALFLYFVIRAGFLSGTTVTIEPGALPWGLLAVAGLSGLFYDKTYLKLREVFTALLKADDHRDDKLDPPESEEDDQGGGDGNEGGGDDDGGGDGAGNEGGADGPVTGEETPPTASIQITTTGLPEAKVGEEYDVALERVGGRDPVVWRVTPTLPSGLRLHPGTGRIQGRPVAPAPRATFVFTAMSSAHDTHSASLELEVKP